MHSTHALPGTVGLPQGKSAKHSGKGTKPANRAANSTSAAEEIEAYIAIRDGLLAAAEKAATCEMLRRVSIANDFVETCLKPARSPYETQFLPEGEAARERERCQAAKARIAQLATHPIRR